MQSLLDRSQQHTTSRLKRLSLRLQLIFAFVLLVTLSFATIGLVVMQTARQSLVDHAITTLHTQSQNSVGVVSALLERQVVGLQTLGLHDSILNLAIQSNGQYRDNPTSIASRLADQAKRWRSLTNQRYTNQPGEASVATALRRYLAANTDILDIAVLDQYGTLLHATHRPIWFNQSHVGWWESAIHGRVVICPPSYDDISSSYGILIAVPIREPGQEEVVGILTATYRAAALSQAISQLRIGTTGETHILLSPQHYLSDRGMVIDIQPDYRAMIHAAQTQRYAQMQFHNQPHLLVTAPINLPATIDPLPWKIVITQELDEVLGSLYASWNSGLLMLLVIMVVAIAKGVVLAELISAPLRHATNTARQITAGNQQLRMALHGNDELGELAQSFNTMLDALLARTASEQQAQEERLRLQQEVIQTQEALLTQLSAPCVPLPDRALLVPMIGSFNHQRIEQVQHHLTRAILHYRSEHVLLDLTGMAHGEGFDELLRPLLESTRVLGAHVVIIGRHPAIHQLVATYQPTIRSYPDLEQALATVVPSYR